MKFQKGHKINNGRIPWNKGKTGIYSKETLDKISSTSRKIWSNPEYVKLQSLRHKGQKLSEENLIKLIKINRGKKLSQETKDKISRANTGRKMSEETKNKLRGANNHLWKGGISSVNQLVRHSYAYKQWRKQVFERDEKKCILCGSKNNLQIDHIKSFALFPELRFSLKNGRTLCELCHRKTDSWGINKSYYEKYLQTNFQLS